MKLLAPLFRRLGFEPIRKGKRDFPAAAINRLTNDWRSMGVSLDSLLRQDLSVLRTRARDLQESNEYFQKFLTMLKTNVLGENGMVFNSLASGLPRFQNGKLVPGTPDRMDRTILESSWEEWKRKENCTVAKDMTFLKVEQVALETAGTDGETLWRKVRGAAAGNKFNFALQPIETDRIDSNKNEKLANGNTIRLGVERDSLGRKVAFWLHDSDPTDSLIYTGGWTSKRYDAQDFIHPHLIRRIGQTRGVPWAAAALMRVKMLAGYEEAEIEGSRAAACKMAFLVDPPDGNGQEYSGAPAEGGGKFMDAEPGCMEDIGRKDIKVVDWNHPNSIFPDFTAACKMGIACALSMSYPRMFGDYGSINFSAGRLAQSDDDRVWCYLIKWFCESFHDEIFPDWLEMALLSNAVSVQIEGGKVITLPASKKEKFLAHSWMGPESAWFDPVKEIQAQTESLNSGQTTLTELWSKANRDRDEMLEEIAADQDELRKRGIILPNLYDHATKKATDGQGNEAQPPAPVAPAKKPASAAAS
jgi:lambda family phage portal protein